MSLEYARSVLDVEIAALSRMRDGLDTRFVEAVEKILSCSGRVVTCGMGKAGLIAQKISATMASTGTPSFYLHPADALHGDLGMVRPDDVVLILSNSGESDEVTRLLPFLRGMQVPVVAMTAQERSTLAAHADIVLLLGDIEEACPLGLAPTATTTAMLALGDALSLAVMKRRDFQIHDYARLHPAGALGRKVLPVSAVMRTGDAVAIVRSDTLVRDAILLVTAARAGAAAVVDEENHLSGIFTDGDLRRGIEAHADILERPVSEIMIVECIRVREDTLAGDVLEMMKARRIADVPVVDSEDRLLGMADLKGLVASL